MVCDIIPGRVARADCALFHMMRRVVILCLGLLMAATGCSCQPRQVEQSLPPSPGTPPVVRVRLLGQAEQIKLTTTHPIRADVAGQSVELRLPSVTPIWLTLKNDQWHIGDQTLPPGELLLEPARVGSLAVEGVSYRGVIRLVPTKDDQFDVVNEVDVDSYLKGVLAAEMLPDWDMTAFRAQAVVARTYALYEASTRVDRGHWDLFADDRSQVYGGMSAETALSSAAVDATRGLVMAYGELGQEKIFKAYFHSVTGGASLSNYEAFEESRVPPLAARSTGDWGRSSPRYAWAPLTISKDELTRRVRAWGRARSRQEANIGPIEKLEIADRNEFGRPIRFELADSRRQRFSLGPEELRWAVNYDRGRQGELYSSYFSPRVTADSIVFAEGRGFGHGVGLGQYAAQEQAIAGWAWERILAEAYPGSIILRAY